MVSPAGPESESEFYLSASVNFATSSYERTNIGNMYNSQAMSQNTKTSSVSYSRNFPDQHLSISASGNIAQTMRDSSIAVTLPDMTISLSTISLSSANMQWEMKSGMRRFPFAILAV